MKILWQNEHYPDIVKGGGGAINTYYIVKSLEALGHKAVILSRSQNGHVAKQERVKETSVIRVSKPKMPEMLWPLWPVLESYYLKNPVEEIGRGYDGFVCIDAPYALAIKRRYPTRPLVYRVEGLDKTYQAAVPPDPVSRTLSFTEIKASTVERMLKFEDERLEYMAWRRADALVVKSEFMKSQLTGLYNVPAAKVHIIPNGVDFSRYADVRPQAEIIEQLGNADGAKVVIIFSGRLVRMKNLPFLLRAFAQMTLKERCILAILGDGEERSILEAESQALGLRDNVRFLGHTNRVEQYLACADIFVLPSTYEPFGNALVEAMAAGLACVALRPDGDKIRTASAEIIDDGRSGFLVDPRDPSDLAKRLDVLAGDPELRKSVGARGQADCRHRFDWSACALEYVKLLAD